MDQRGQKQIELIRLKDKRQITAVFCCSTQGAFVPPQILCVTGFAKKGLACMHNYKYLEIPF